VSSLARAVRRRAIAAAVAIGLLAASPRGAPADEPTDHEFLTELDGSIGLGARTGLLLLLRQTRDSDFEPAENLLGAHFDYAAARDLKLRAGYRYARSFDDDVTLVEQRVLAEVTPRRRVAAGILASFRHRVEVRWHGGDPSARYRPRLQLERSFALGAPRELTPYASAEPFYDTRFDTWARWRYEAGVETTISDVVMVDTFYRREDDLRPARTHLDTIGLGLHFTRE
jgi:hypothetical protein